MAGRSALRQAHFEARLGLAERIAAEVDGETLAGGGHEAWFLSGLGRSEWACIESHTPDLV